MQKSHFYRMRVLKKDGMYKKEGNYKTRDLAISQAMSKNYKYIVLEKTYMESGYIQKTEFMKIERDEASGIYTVYKNNCITKEEMEKFINEENNINNN